MKTPDEIKKGLAICCGYEISCRECPYDCSPNSCDGSPEEDAIEYINQLESRLAQVEMERDAAIRDCARFPCGTCADKVNGDLCHNCNVRKDTTRTNYEWRGVCPENAKEE